MYFDNFPKFLYDFDINGQKQYTLVKDITVNVRLRKEILSNVTVYDEYDIKEGETPEIIAEKVYGSPLYHWVIMICNEKYDYVNDFPLSTYELENHVKQKYGTEVYSTHHFVDSIGKLCDSSINSITIDDRGSKYLEVPNVTIVRNPLDTDTVHKLVPATATAVIENGFVTKINITNSGKGYYNIPSVVIDTPYTISTFSTFASIPGVEGTQAKASASITAAASVSNYDYEVSVNESKRRIKLISPKLLGTILKNFKDIV